MNVRVACDFREAIADGGFREGGTKSLAILGAVVIGDV